LRAGSAPTEVLPYTPGLRETTAATTEAFEANLVIVVLRETQMIQHPGRKDVQIAQVLLSNGQHDTAV
jgi:hypothetical protein